MLANASKSTCTTMNNKTADELKACRLYSAARHVLPIIQFPVLATHPTLNSNDLHIKTILLAGVACLLTLKAMFAGTFYVARAKLKSYMNGIRQVIAE